MADTAQERLEYLRRELRAERISYGELAELQSLAGEIAPEDVELLEAAGVPEFPRTRRALVELGTYGTPEGVAALLPGNYRIADGWQTAQVRVVVEGTDVAGWTLDDYVLPRLASGLYFGTELEGAPQ